MAMTRKNQVKSNQIKSRQGSTGGGSQRPVDCYATHRTALQHMAQASRRYPLAAMPCSTDVTQELTSFVASLLDALLCVSLWGSDGREGEMEQLESYEERWNWRLGGGEELPIVSGQLCQLGVLVRSQPKLSLRVMSEFMDMKWQGSVLMSLAHITTREVPGWSSCLGPPGCQWAV